MAWKNAAARKKNVKDTEIARSVWLSTTAKIKNILFRIVKE
jgi:hypothetical protein